MPAASHVHSVSHPLKDMNTALKWDPLHTKSRETIACSFFLFFFLSENSNYSNFTE